MSEAEDNVKEAIVKQLTGSFENIESTSEPIEKYEFDAEFQSRIASLMVTDVGFVRRTDGLILPDYFENECQAILVNTCQEYFERYKSVPASNSVWKQLLVDKIKAKNLRKDVGIEAIKEVFKLRKKDLSDANYVVDVVAKFAKNAAVAQATMEMIDLAEKGDMEAAQEIMEKAFRVGASEEFTDHDYWNEIERRTQYRKDKLSGLIAPDGIPTGIKKIDRELFHKGWGRKELTVFMGGAKKGKSMALGEFAVRASKLGHNTLYLTCEVSEAIIQDRMDANISSIEMGMLELNLNAVEASVKTNRTAGVGELRVAEFASGTLKVSGIRRILERYRADGIIFDMIVVDYADILAPENYNANSAIENSRLIWLALRALAFEENAAVMTATQTNREGFKSTVAKAGDVADDFNKIRIADLVISINRDEDETREGKARLFFAASRNQAGEFTIRIEQDLAKMKFVKKVTGRA